MKFLVNNQSSEIVTKTIRLHKLITQYFSKLAICQKIIEVFVVLEGFIVYTFI